MTEAGSATFDALLGLGSNIGDKAGNIRRAVALLQEPGDVTLVAASQLYRTAPWGVEDQDWFVNACIAVATPLSARELLTRCLGVEQEMKRVRERHWGPRVIDVDVLTYRDQRIDVPDLIVPHPRIIERGFVLVPLSEIAPELKIDGRTVTSWRDAIETGDILPIEAL